MANRDDQDNGQFGRDARKHLRTTDHAGMKRTAMDAKVGQMRLPSADALSRSEVQGFARTATAIQRNAHLNTEPQNPKHQERAASNFGKVASEVVKKKGNPELAGTYARAAAHHGKKALELDADPEHAEATTGQREHANSPSHYESAMSRKTGASITQLRKEMAAAEKTGYMNRVSPGTRRPSGNPKP